jgi:hypothetical protein
MKAVAVKKGQAQADVASFWEMGTLRCDMCGEEFVIRHHPGFVSKEKAVRKRRRNDSNACCSGDRICRR